jgi:hypothetical protein
MWGTSGIFQNNYQRKQPPKGRIFAESDRCYDHNFLRTIFCEKMAVFGFVLTKKRQFSRNFFGENIFKIITSVPGHPDAEEATRQKSRANIY